MRSSFFTSHPLPFFQALGRVGGVGCFLVAAGFLYGAAWLGLESEKGGALAAVLPCEHREQSSSCLEILSAEDISNAMSLLSLDPSRLG